MDDPNLTVDFTSDDWPSALEFSDEGSPVYAAFDVSTRTIRGLTSIGLSFWGT